MIAIWLLYVVVVGVLAALAAAALERLLRLWRRPVRFVWAGALLATVAAPLVMGLVALDAAAPAETTVVSSLVTGAAMLPTDAVVPSLADRIAASLAGLEAALAPAARRLAPLDRPLLALWTVLSLTLLVALVRSARRLRRRRGEWAPAVVDGVPVLVAPDLGPAVVGGRDARVVLPSWAMQLDAPLRQLVLRHEHEHLRAGDPHLLLAGLAAVIAMPWNPALWWQLGRLRLAVELDCDRRVLRAHGDVERYGLLLMAVSQRGGGLMRLAMPALSESSGALERRIAAMTAATPRRRGARAAALGLAALAVAAAACLVPSPGRLQAATLRESVQPPVRSASADTITVDDSTRTYFEFQVEDPVRALNNVAPTYPVALQAQGVSGQVIAQFVVGTDGAVIPGTIRIIESSHELFTAAVESVLPQMRYRPALVGGQPVRQVVQQSFVFNTRKQDPAASDSVAPAGRYSVRPSSTPRPPTRGAATPDTGGYFEFKVTKQATPANDVSPTYPAALKAQGLTGQVIVQFVVGEDGKPDPSTFKVIESSHELFTAAVRDALPLMLYAPAEADGHPVRQVVQQAFVFTPDR
ncbi:MAG TPA: M56 family metallopeptidase [Gemmatimonadaceae bacterium]|nr:M56 family metallopeptidase [Gemmatimonadaceae bacterium]